MMPKIESKPNPRYATENVDAGVPGAVEAFKAQQAAKVPTPNMSSKAPAAAMSFGGFGKALGTPNVNFDSSGPQFAPKANPADVVNATLGPVKEPAPAPAQASKSDSPAASDRVQLVNRLRAMNNLPSMPDASSFNEFQTNLNKSVAEMRARARANGQEIPDIVTGAEAVPSNPRKPGTTLAKAKPSQSSLARGEDPFGDKATPTPKPEGSDMLGDAMGFLSRNKYPIGAGLGAAGLAALLYNMNQPKKKKRDDDEE
jgi:hypothetical protein